MCVLWRIVAKLICVPLIWQSTLVVMMKPLVNHIIAVMKGAQLLSPLDNTFCDTKHCMSDHFNSFALGKVVMQLSQSDINYETIPVHIRTKDHIHVPMKIVKAALYHFTNCKITKVLYTTRKSDIFAATKDVMPSS